MECEENGKFWLETFGSHFYIFFRRQKLSKSFRKVPKKILQKSPNDPLESENPSQKSPKIPQIHSIRSLTTDRRTPLRHTSFYRQPTVIIMQYSAFVGISFLWYESIPFNSPAIYFRRSEI